MRGEEDKVVEENKEKIREGRRRRRKTKWKGKN